MNESKRATNNLVSSTAIASTIPWPWVTDLSCFLRQQLTEERNVMFSYSFSAK